jgi:hypothetical protein
VKSTNLSEIVKRMTKPATREEQAPPVEEQAEEQAVDELAREVMQDGINQAFNARVVNVTSDTADVTSDNTSTPAAYPYSIGNPSGIGPIPYISQPNSTSVIAPEPKNTLRFPAAKEHNLSPEGEILLDCLLQAEEIVDAYESETGEPLTQKVREVAANLYTIRFTKER